MDSEVRKIRNCNANDVVLDTAIDAAILDINLDGEKVYPLADFLMERRIPLVFATGYETSTMPEKYRGFILCEKPTELAAIAVALFAPDRLCH
jgi:hypothetical protein